jgi:hypothetical protein
MVEAKRILDLIQDAQRNFKGAFEPWMGGGRSDESGMQWLDNPQFKLTVGEAPMKVSVNVDKAGSAEFEAYNVHVVKPAHACAIQLGEAYEVVAAAEYDAATCTLNFEAEAGAVYLLVPSTLEPKSVGGFSITTIGTIPFMGPHLHTPWDPTLIPHGAPPSRRSVRYHSWDPTSTPHGTPPSHPMGPHPHDDRYDTTHGCGERTLSSLVACCRVCCLVPHAPPYRLLPRASRGRCVATCQGSASTLWRRWGSCRWTSRLR